MKCFDKTAVEEDDDAGASPPIELFGNYDSPTAKAAMIVFEKCDRELRSDCKSEEIITKWLHDKYFIVLENTEEFLSHAFDRDRITKLS